MQKKFKPTLAVGILAATIFGMTSASAVPTSDIRITEVAPTGSSHSYAADWFELTNIGLAAVDITGWKMDDNSFLAASALALSGVTSINPGQSVVFAETSNLATTKTAFISAWFAGSAPAGFTMGAYTGSGVGLSATGDGVIIFNSSNAQMAKVSFGAASATNTFDNAQGLDNTAISLLSVAGVNGAFSASPLVGSPGAVPLPAAVWLLGSALTGIGALRARRRQI